MALFDRSHRISIYLNSIVTNVQTFLRLNVNSPIEKMVTIKAVRVEPFTARVLN